MCLTAGRYSLLIRALTAGLLGWRRAQSSQAPRPAPSQHRENVVHDRERRNENAQPGGNSGA